MLFWNAKFGQLWCNVMIWVVLHWFALSFLYIAKAIDAKHHISSKSTNFALQNTITFLALGSIISTLWIKKSAILLSNQTLKSILDVVFSIYTPKSDLIISENFRKSLIHVLDQQENSQEEQPDTQLINQQPQEQKQQA